MEKVVVCRLEVCFGGLLASLFMELGQLVKELMDNVTKYNFRGKLQFTSPKVDNVF
jgi:hypothetical protein